MAKLPRGWLGPRPEFVMGQLFHDPTPNAAINQRIATPFLMVAKDCEFKTRGEQFARDLAMLSTKLGSVWYHLDRYKNAEIKAIAKERTRPVAFGARTATIGYDNEMVFEFDAFVIQVKSTLDHLKNMPAFFIGKAWKLATFGNKGEDVASAALNNAPADLKGHAAGLANLIKGNQEWLAEIIDLRDRLNHMIEGGIDASDLLMIYAQHNESGDVVVNLPKLRSEETVLQVLTTMWVNLFLFVEEFLAICLSMGLKRCGDLLVASVPQPPSPLESNAPYHKRVTLTEWLAAAGPEDWPFRIPTSKEQRRNKTRKHK